MLDKKTFTIGCLSLSAVILIAANILAPHLTSASYSTTHDDNYSIVVASAGGGSDAVYVTDKRSGKMALFAYDPNRKGLVNLDVKPVQNAFAKALANAGKK